MHGIDFRNQPVKEIEAILTQKEFSPQKINNFKNAIRTQNILEIKNLKNVKNPEQLTSLLPFQPLSLIKSIKDKNNNEKFIFKTFDNHFIESVLMPDKADISICISVQAGCRFNCSFCRTGKIGFIRDLFAHEILDQVRQINILRVIPERISCISFMGMGEPFDNLPNCMLALHWIGSNFGWQISRRKVTFSTSGCISFDEFFKYDKLPNLALSLHFADEYKRKKYMNKSEITLPKLKEYLIEYTKREKNPVSIEYCLMKNINDSALDAECLAEYLYGLPCKVNLMNFNPISNSNFKPVESIVIEKFKKKLKEKKIPVLFRKSLGVEINAGCGQLGEILGKLSKSES
jgi:23S rRNA (adenine2503-C2)-methyltransferase